MHKLKITFSLAAVAALVGCNSGSSGSSEPPPPPLWTDEKVADVVECTTLRLGGTCDQNVTLEAWGTLDPYIETCNHIVCFEDGSEPPEVPGLLRWREGRLIPTYVLGADDVRFTKAMDYVEDLIGYQLFDRKGIIDLDISNPIAIDYSGLETDWGFIWSQGTTWGNCGSGTVSQGPYIFNINSYLADSGQAYIKNAKDIFNKDGLQFTWINIDGDPDNAQEGCTVIASQEVVYHELGHALGMGNHFPGFGTGAAWDSNAERVLKTMYHRENPPGQPYDSLYIAE